MDEVERFCTRMVGDTPEARSAAEAARAAGGDDRLAVLRAAVAECRRRTGAEAAPPAAADGAAADLSAAVPQELAAAAGRLPVQEREALALCHLTGLSYDEIAAVTGGSPVDMPLLLAGARLGLRAQLRGSPGPAPDCPEHDRALRTIAARQDGEPVPAADEDWLIEHLGICRGCARNHAALLEAAVRYRAWGAAEASAGRVDGES